MSVSRMSSFLLGNAIQPSVVHTELKVWLFFLTSTMGEDQDCLTLRLPLVLLVLMWWYTLLVYSNSSLFVVPLCWNSSSWAFPVLMLAWQRTPLLAVANRVIEVPNCRLALHKCMVCTGQYLVSLAQTRDSDRHVSLSLNQCPGCVQSFLVRSHHMGSIRLFIVSKEPFSLSLTPFS